MEGAKGGQGLRPGFEQFLFAPLMKAFIGGPSTRPVSH